MPLHPNGPDRRLPSQAPPRDTEAAALLIWVPVLFVTFDGGRRHVEATGLALAQGLATVCICASVATFVMLGLGAVAQWYSRDRAEATKAPLT
jgi:hypothetical protein